MPPPGIQDIKQVDIYLKYCCFILKTYQKDICPKLSANKIKLIKEQQTATSKKRLEKLKIIKDTIEDNSGLFESEDIVIDDNRNSAYVVVNKVESNGEDKSHTASSSDFDSEGEEE